MSAVNKSKFSEQFFAQVVKVFKYNKRMKLVEIDFSKPWWDLLVQQKRLVFINILNQLFGNVILALAPVAVAYAIERQDVKLFLLIILVIALSRLLAHIMYYFDPILRIQSSQSITYSANKFFLTTDPINHSNRSSGEIISKINRASTGIESLLGLVTLEFLSLGFTIISTVWIFWNFNYIYGLVVLGSLSFIIFFNIICFYYRSKIQKIIIKYEDKAQTINVETLQQTHYIRSGFATPEQAGKMFSANTKRMYLEASSWRLAGYIISTTQFLFFISLAILGYLIITNKDVNVVIAASLLVSYFNIGNQIYFIGYSVNQLIKHYIGITDLYSFIRNFGKQTYPVLEGDNAS